MVMAKADQMTVLVHTGVSIVYSTFVQAQINENITTRWRHLPWGGGGGGGGESAVTGEFPAQSASNAGNVSML